MRLSREGTIQFGFLLDEPALLEAFDHALLPLLSQVPLKGDWHRYGERGTDGLRALGRIDPRLARVLCLHGAARAI